MRPIKAFDGGMLHGVGSRSMNSLTKETKHGSKNGAF